MMSSEQLDLDMQVSLYNNSKRGYKTSREAKRKIKLMRATMFKHKALISFAINKRKLMEKIKKIPYYSEYYSHSCKEEL